MGIVELVENRGGEVGWEVLELMWCWNKAVAVVVVEVVVMAGDGMDQEMDNIQEIMD